MDEILRCMKKKATADIMPQEFSKKFFPPQKPFIEYERAEILF